MIILTDIIDWNTKTVGSLVWNLISQGSAFMPYQAV